MINMISFAQLDKFETKKGAVAAESGETEPKIEDFAALLSVPVELSNLFANKNTDAGETSAKGDKIESVTNLSATNVQTLTAQNQTDLNAPDLSKTDSETLSAEAQELVKTSLETGKMEILENSKSPEKPKISDFYQNDFAENPNSAEKNVFSNFLPKLFSQVSSDLKKEESAKTNQQSSQFEIFFEDNSSDEAQIISQIKSNTADTGSALNLDQPEIKTGGEKQFKAPENFSAVSFDKVLNSVIKEAKSGKTAAQVLARPADVLNQVEPKLMQIIALNNIENEKKTMKMRLHPAELGTVEIRLEKDSSGKLTAHFQTENEKTRQILNQSLDQLRETLQNSGWQIERMDVSCSPFSSTADGNRENEARQFEAVENKPNTKADFDRNSDSQNDLTDSASNRLLSVRA